MSSNFFPTNGKNLKVSFEFPQVARTSVHGVNKIIDPMVENDGFGPNHMEGGFMGLRFTLIHSNINVGGRGTSVSR